MVAVLLILSFPFKLRPTESSNWKTHLILFLVSFCVPLLILVVFWGVDPVRYEIVNHPLVCLPEPTAIVVTLSIPLTLTLGLSLTSVLLIVSQLIINQVRLRRHKTSAMNKKQTQFIIRTLGVIISFTIISLFLTIEFGARVSFSKPFNSYVELYWACITRYGTNTSCCVDNYNQFYHPELTVLNDFFFSFWGMVALSTLAVKEARKFWINFFTKWCCCHKVSSTPKQEVYCNSKQELELPPNTQVSQNRRWTEVLMLRSFEKSNKETATKTETKSNPKTK